MAHMAARDRAPSRPIERGDRRRALSVALDLIGRGETVLTLIDPSAEEHDPDAYGRWLSARLTIGELPRLMLPPCDGRCAGLVHDPDRFFAMSDLALDLAEPRRSSWWAGWNDTLEALHQSGRVWDAGAPALPHTSSDGRVTTGTRLLRIASTDPRWVTYDGAPQETIYRIMSGPRAGDSLVAITFGPASLLPALAGALIAPDHPPARDPMIAIRLLAAGWSAVERGLPFEGS